MTSKIDTAAPRPSHLRSNHQQYILVLSAMIIAEPTSQSPLKPQQQLNEQGSRPNNPPQSPPPYVPSPEYLPTVQSHHVEHRQSPSRRFFEAFCVAVAIYVLAGMFMSSVTWNMHRGRHRRPSHVRKLINHGIYFEWYNSSIAGSSYLAGRRFQNLAYPTFGWAR